MKKYFNHLKYTQCPDPDQLTRMLQNLQSIYQALGDVYSAKENSELSDELKLIYNEYKDYQTAPSADDNKATKLVNMLKMYQFLISNNYIEIIDSQSDLLEEELEPSESEVTSLEDFLSYIMDEL